MLVASLNGRRIDADIAGRGPAYRCPGCDGVVILRKGRKVIAHFAHKPPHDCLWAKGETAAHREAKRILAGALNKRGVTAIVECVVSTLPGDRRADVLAVTKAGMKTAFELQHTSISLDEIEARAFAYARVGVAQIWIPFIRKMVWENGEQLPDGKWFVEKYTARPFEKWAHGLHKGKGMWMYDPSDRTFWRASLDGHEIYVEASSWYSEDGEEQYSGGYARWSKKWRELTLTGPYDADELRVGVERRRAYRTSGYNWPSGKVAHFIPS